MRRVNLEQIRKLRAKTQASVIDCKTALEKGGGDFKKALVWLQKRGKAKAEKKKGRKTPEGLVGCYIHNEGRIGVLVELLCETDFVAKNPDFKKLAHELCLQIAAMKPKDIKTLLNQEYIRDPSKKIGDLLTEAIAKFGENIVIKRFERFEIGEKS